MYIYLVPGGQETLLGYFQTDSTEFGFAHEQSPSYILSSYYYGRGQLKTQSKGKLRPTLLQRQADRKSLNG